MKAKNLKTDSEILSDEKIKEQTQKPIEIKGVVLKFYAKSVGGKKIPKYLKSVTEVTPPPTFV